LESLPLPLLDAVGLVPLSECVQQARCLLGEAGRLWQRQKDRADGFDGRPVISTSNVVLERVHGAVSAAVMAAIRYSTNDMYSLDDAETPEKQTSHGALDAEHGEFVEEFLPMSLHSSVMMRSLNINSVDDTLHLYRSIRRGLAHCHHNRVDSRFNSIADPGAAVAESSRRFVPSSK